MFKRPPTTKSTTPIRSSTLRKLRAALPSPSLLPDGSTQMKALTHLDAPLIIYAQPAADGGNPVAFQADEASELVPTVWALQKTRGFLPELVTAAAVLPHLVTGSSLFITGLLQSSLAALPDGIREGALVAVVADDEVIAVGTLDASKEQLLKRKEGKGVNTLQVKGDFLWKMGKGNEETAEVTEGGTIAQATPMKGKGKEKQMDDAPDVAKADAAEAPAQLSLSPEQAAKVLLDAFLLALRISPPTLPQPAAALYASHVLPFRPADRSDVEVKKSSYKKVGALFKAASKQDVITIKEKKDDVTIVSFDARHPDVEASRSYLTVAQATARQAESSAASLQQSTTSNSMTFRELWKVPSTFSFIFPNDKLPTPPLLGHSELKAVVVNYASDNNLLNPNDGSFFRLTFDFASLLETEEGWGKKDDVLQELKDLSESWYQVGEEKPKKGQPPMITITIKPVGNRTTTTVTNFQPWGVGEAYLQEGLRKRAATSASVHENKQGKKSKDVLVQGTHDKLVKALLEEAGIPKKIILVDDKTKAKSKK